MATFQPLFRNPHMQTIVAHFWPRPDPDRRYPLARRLYRTEPEVEVLVESQTPEGAPKGDVVMVHGLEGSGRAGYIRSLSALALDAGFAAHRFHLRTCGGTEHLSPTLYHAGMTGDLLSVLKQMRSEGRGPVYLVGFSVGGNVVMKLAGELGESAAEWIDGVVAVSTPLDLGACARRISERDNYLYEQRFVKKMRARLCATGRYTPSEFEGLDTLLAIDNRITAPAFGFGDAANYYRTQSSLHVVDQIRVPVLMVQAKDDTFVPFEVFETAAVRGNPSIEIVATEAGGHLGFIGRRGQRFWLDRTIMNWIVHRQGL